MIFFLEFLSTVFYFILHNLCVLNSNLLDNILYLVTFIFKLAKHKMAAKMKRNSHICYGLSHMKAY